MSAEPEIIAAVENESAFSETLKICLYGRWGTLKTQQIDSLIRDFGRDHIAVVSAEGGLGTIESSVKSENVIRVSNKSEMRKAWARCEKEFKGPESWVCIDGMSAVMMWIANEQFAGANEYYDQISIGIPHDAIESRLKPYGKFLSNKDEVDGQKIYGEIGRQSQLMLAAWVSLTCNLYANYLEDMTGTTGREKTIPWGPDVPGKVGLGAVMSKFDHIIRVTYNKDGKLIGGLDPASPLYLSRTREDRNKIGTVLPKEIVGFDLGEFVSKYLKRKR